MGWNIFVRWIAQGIAGILRRRCGQEFGRSLAFQIVFFLSVGAPMGWCLGADLGLLREVFANIEGNAVADLTNSPAYPHSPTERSVWRDFFEGPRDERDRYGQRLHGYLVPPVTGAYTFFISSDDNSALFLSTDADPARARVICRLNSWSGFRQWDREPEQRSDPILLEAGRPYYVAALSKDGVGGDHLSVRWVRPDGVDEGPIPADHLRVFGAVHQAPALVDGPKAATVAEGGMAEFRVEWDPLGPAEFQWQRNGVDLAGEAGATLRYGPVRWEEDGAQFRVRLKNVLGEVWSAPARLTVLRDLDAPVVIRGYNVGAREIRVEFNESVQLKDPAIRVEPAATVDAASVRTEGNRVRFVVSPLEMGRVYRVRIDGVWDRAATPNPLADDAEAVFIAAELAPAQLGAQTASMPMARLGERAFLVAGNGGATGARTDAGGWAWEERTGDFDVAVRVSELEVGSVWASAGLVARTGFEERAASAGVFSGAVQTGCWFEGRATSGGLEQRLAPNGGYPVNGSETWLRLARVDRTLFGYASREGSHWTLLGTVTWTEAPPTAFVGVMASSGLAERATSARFRDYGPARVGSSDVPVPQEERMGPSRRSTGVVVSEIYLDGGGGTGLAEFVEVYNGGAIFEDLTGYRLTGAREFEFPPGFVLEAGEFAVVALDAGRTRVALSKVVSPLRRPIEGGGETLSLRNERGVVIWETRLDRLRERWPAGDGLGASWVLRRPSLGEGDVSAWGVSARNGGAPGQGDALWASKWSGVRLNEVFARATETMGAFVEFHNASGEERELGGLELGFVGGRTRFRLPDALRLAPGGFGVIRAEELGVRIPEEGGVVFLAEPGGAEWVDVWRYPGQVAGRSVGRLHPGARFDGVGNLLPTPGAANGAPSAPAAVISEVLYHPFGDPNLEFIELFNPGTQEIDLGGWRLAGGIRLEFPAGVKLAAGGYGVATRNRAALQRAFPGVPASVFLGDYSGALGNGGDRARLLKPEHVVAPDEMGVGRAIPYWAVVDEIEYRDGGSWPATADGEGASLARIRPASDGRLASSWRAQEPQDRGASRVHSWTGVLELGHPDFPPSNEANPLAPSPQLQILLLGPGEVWVDQVRLERDGVDFVVNGDFEQGQSAWFFQGNHETSRIEQGVGLGGGWGLRVAAQGRGDTGPNRIRGALKTGLRVGDRISLSAELRWIRGRAPVLIRVRGGWAEAVFRPPEILGQGSPGAGTWEEGSGFDLTLSDGATTPVIPADGEAVVFRVRVSGATAARSVRLALRKDPEETVTFHVARDDGLDGDAQAADRVYSARVPGQVAGTLMGYWYEVESENGSVTREPRVDQRRENLIRWGDRLPAGTLPTYSLWTTAATEAARLRDSGLNNTYRPAAFVYQGARVIQGAEFRDKGSPFHSGRGDFEVRFPKDDSLLGADEIVLASTGNGESEATHLREQVSFWIARGMGLPHLNRRYVHLLRNGVAFREIMEDAEEPNEELAETWLPGNDTAELYKVDDWMEFADNGLGFLYVDASLEPFRGSDGAYKIGRYRWSWRPRGSQSDSADFAGLMQLVSAANRGEDPPGSYVQSVREWADIEQWMRTFAFERICGNFDSYGYARGKNLYLHRSAGGKFRWIPWDVDFTLGSGAAANDGLWGGRDPVINRMFDTPEFRRMLWRAYRDALLGPLRSEAYLPQIQERHEVLRRNGISRLAAPESVRSYLAARVEFLKARLAEADAPGFRALTAQRLESATSPVLVEGLAPFAVERLEVNGAAWPVEWVEPTRWRIRLPLHQEESRFVVRGVDSQGMAIAGAETEFVVRYSGSIGAVRVLINEAMTSNSASVQDPEDGDYEDWFELHNPGTSAVDLSGFWLNDTPSLVGATAIPMGFQIPAGGYLLVWADGEPNQTSAARGSLHAGFRLKTGGDSLVLLAQDGTVIDSVTIPPLGTDVAWGLPADGFSLTRRLLSRPSPGRANFDAASARGVTVSARRTPEGIALSWLGELGGVYRLEQRESLTDGGWVGKSAVVGTGAEETVLLKGATSVSHYFRVQRQP